jgi:lipopolysaccharide export system protein LptA
MIASPKVTTAFLLGGAVACLAPVAGARAQAIDLSHGGQITVTAAGGFDWDQNNQTVTAYDQAQAVRENVTVIGDRLVAFYRKKAIAPASARNGAPAGTAPSTGTSPGASAPQGSPPPAPSTGGTQAAATSAQSGGAQSGGTQDSGSNEVYRLNAFGHVHIFTETDQAWGDKAVYDIDQAVLVMTGKALKMVTPQDVLTARDSMEYYSQTRISIGRGNATVTTNDGRQIRADVLVGYSAPSQPAGQPGTPSTGKTAGAQPAAPQSPAPQDGKTSKSGGDPLTSSGKLEKVNAFGHVFVRTPTETVTGDRGVYVPDTGIARIVGNVHITRGQNQINGAAAIVNMHTGIATMTERAGSRVSGLLVPNEANGSPGGTTAAPPGKKPVPAGPTASPAGKPL